MKTFSLPSKGEYPPYYETYISELGDANFSELLMLQIEQLKTLLASKAAGWETTPYAPGKWSPKELLGHLIDTERIMTFRALCIARGDKNSFPGFDQDPYVQQGKFDAVPLELLLADFKANPESQITAEQIKATWQEKLNRLFFHFSGEADTIHLALIQEEIEEDLIEVINSLPNAPDESAWEILNEDPFWDEA